MRLRPGVALECDMIFKESPQPLGALSVRMSVATSSANVGLCMYVCMYV